MILIYVIIAFVALWGLRFRKQADTFAALTIEQSTMIKGIFVLLVFAAHTGQYLNPPAGFMTRSYQFIRSNVGQLTVVPFLFYSGYGVRYSISRKGDTYIKSIPRKRMLRVYSRTVIILLLFLSVQTILGQRYSFGQILWAFTLLGSFGNSNWYLFAILFLYGATWLSFRQGRPIKWACLLCFLFSAMYFGVFSMWKARYWYDTIFIYSFGLVFLDLEKLFGKIIKRTLEWASTCVVLTVLILLLSKVPFPHILDGIMENIRATLFMFLIIAFLARIQVGNVVLKWLGSNVFLCYLLQRLPMIVLNHFGVSKSSIPLFVVGSAIGTVLLVLLLKEVMIRLERQ